MLPVFSLRNQWLLKMSETKVLFPFTIFLELENPNSFLSFFFSRNFGFDIFSSWQTLPLAVYCQQYKTESMPAFFMNMDKYVDTQKIYKGRYFFLKSRLLQTVWITFVWTFFQIVVYSLKTYCSFFQFLPQKKLPT